MSNSRILIFIVAYNHEKTIQSVLSRIPETLPASETEVLIIDDASEDQTFDISTEHPETHDFPFKLTVLYNPVNQGYGGNQKIGYHYAIEHGFDVVALVHGDGQYAPEKLPDLIAPLVAGEADAVFGSRMIEKGAARKGGMPLYKFVGNKILSSYQNLLLGTRLSEFHSGYRAYSVSALKKIPFELNTNDFHFDTEIIIQLMLADMRIKEISIPTYYGDEICHVDGLKYAFNVVKATNVGVLQKLGVFYESKFDVQTDGPEGSHYEPKLGFSSSHTMAVEAVRPGSAVLNIGCAGGYVSAELKKMGCTVTGIDQYPIGPDSPFDRFFEVDIDRDGIPLAMEGIDHVLLLDVIEHLSDPERFVKSLAAQARMHPETNFIVTSGNIGFFVIRLMLLLGQFNYGKRGILDMTHKRLFTFRSLRQLFEQRGFSIEKAQGIPVPFPLALGDNALSRVLLAINRFLIVFSKDIFAYQIFIVAKPWPSLPWLLRETNEATKRRKGSSRGKPTKKASEKQG